MRLATAFGAVLLIASACSAPASTASGARTIEIEMKEFAFSPPRLTLNAGEKVTLRFRNAGTVEHEFMAGREARPSEGFAQDVLAGITLDMTGGAGHMDGMGHGGGGMRMNAGQAGTLAFVVPDRKGSYEFGCFVAGHYEGGMKGTLVIE